MGNHPKAKTELQETRSGLEGLAKFETLPLPQHQQFEYWQSLFENIALDLVDPSLKREPFDGEAVAGMASNGIAFGRSKSANTRAKFGVSGHDNILLSLSLSGSVAILDNAGSAQSVDPAAGLVLIDIGRSSSIVSHGEHSHVFLSIPRELALSGLAHDPFCKDPVIKMPGSSGLESFLSANLQMLGQQAEHLSADEAELAIRQTAELALTCLSTGAGADDPERSRAYRASFLQACDHIDRHLGDPDLTADAIAVSLGFSRAHLYRVFASHGKTVAGVLRDHRLARARDLIAAGRAGHLDAVAFAVGYHSTAAFGRAFKKQFGVSPRGYRMFLARS